MQGWFSCRGSSVSTLRCHRWGRTGHSPSLQQWSVLPTAISSGIQALLFVRSQWSSRVPRRQQHSCSIRYPKKQFHALSKGCLPQAAPLTVSQAVCRTPANQQWGLQINNYALSQKTFLSDISGSRNQWLPVAGLNFCSWLKWQEQCPLL